VLVKAACRMNVDEIDTNTRFQSHFTVKLLKETYSCKKAPHTMKVKLKRDCKVFCHLILTLNAVSYKQREAKITEYFKI